MKIHGKFKSIRTKVKFDIKESKKIYYKSDFIENKK